MALETPIVQSGYLQLSMQEIFKVPKGKVVHINSIRLNNVEDEDFHVELFQFVNGVKSQLIFKFDLDAGDIVADDTIYMLADNYSIYGMSDVTTVSYTINANFQV